MRILVRTNYSEDQIVGKIVENLDVRGDLDFAAIYYVGSGEEYQSPRIEYRPVNFCSGIGDYSGYNYGPIDRPILDKMLPYKSMALNIIMREGQLDIYRLDYCERCYYRILAYWIGVLKDDDIDLIVFLVEPHWAGEYILYALAKVLGIKTIIFRSICMFGYMTWGTSMYEIGKCIRDEFISLKKENKEIVLNEDFSRLADKLKGLQDGIFSAAEKKKITSNVRKRENYKLLRYRLIRYLKVYAFRKETRIKYLARNKLKDVVKLLLEEKRLDKQKEYNKFSIEPDYSRKYIYFALQETPEATTMPLAGEFKNQLLSIMLLSEATKDTDIVIYVKEHWVQDGRPSGFYKTISELENVYLVKEMGNNIELTKNSVAVSTQTGSCILEGMVFKKPALVFGEGYFYKGAPNVIFIKDLDYLRKTIKNLDEFSNTLKDEDTTAYLKAIENTAVRLYVDSVSETTGLYDVNESAKFISNIIRKVNYTFC